MANGLRFDLTRLAQICVALIWISMAVELVYAWDAFSLRGFLDAVDAGTMTYAELEAEASRVDSRSSMIGIAYSVMTVVTGIFSLVWIYRASWNAREIQPAEGRISPGWAVGWYFVPILSLWMPYQAMRQCWNASHNPAGDINAPAPGFVAGWWGLWVVTTLMSHASFQFSIKAETTDNFRVVGMIDLIAAPASILCSLLFIRLIRAITKAQRDASPGGLASVFA